MVKYGNNILISRRLSPGSGEDTVLCSEGPPGFKVPTRPQEHMDASSGGIYAMESAFLDRAVQVGVAGDKVISVSFPADLDPEAGTDHPLLERIKAYLDGAEDDFADVDVGLTVPTDQRNVLETLRKVSYGNQVSLEALARSSPGLDEDDVHVVRTALSENPVPLLIPDHRVGHGPSAAPPEVEQRLRSVEGL